VISKVYAFNPEYLSIPNMNESGFWETRV